MTIKKPGSSRAENAAARAQELHKKADSVIITAYETELQELRSELEKQEKQHQRQLQQKEAELKRYRSLDEQLSRLAQKWCDASEFGGGSTGGNAIKALASRLNALTELEAKVRSNAPSAEQIEHIEKQERIHSTNFKKAATLAIFDSIIFAMSNWSTEGDNAPDFELACQSTLFPVIYQRVMAGDDDYFIEEVPNSATEVVRQGRELIQHLRETEESSLANPAVWEKQHEAIHLFWTQDLLPQLYGGRSEEWDTDTPLTLDEINEWKDCPASRALKFPLIFDGMELVEKHRDDIREQTGLPDFNRATLQTRLTPSWVS